MGVSAGSFEILWLLRPVLGLTDDNLIWHLYLVTKLYVQRMIPFHALAIL